MTFLRCRETSEDVVVNNLIHQHRFVKSQFCIALTTHLKETIIEDHLQLPLLQQPVKRSSMISMSTIGAIDIALVMARRASL